MTPSETKRIYAQCTRFLRGNYPKKLPELLQELAEAAGPDEEDDAYGKGAVIEDFEAQIASFLGKEAAVFLPSGTMAQPIALRIWSDRKSRPRVAFHSTSHLELHEQQGYRRLHGLESILLGRDHYPIEGTDVESLTAPWPSAILLELPQREIGGALPSWGELLRIREWTAARGIALHLDGARLWESGPAYGRSYAEIASLFDSVYVSFYKGLGGITGAILAGSSSFIVEARIWQRRQGGNLRSLFPYVISAREAFKHNLPKIPHYCEKAASLARVLQSIDGIRTTPDNPLTNMMHVHLRGDLARLEKAALEIALETKTLLFRKLQPSRFAGMSSFELNVGDATLDLSDEEIHALFTGLLEQAST